MDPVNVGIVGCGNISGQYLRHARNFPLLKVAACADLMRERAQAKAAEFGVPRACSVNELLADPTIQIVVNLTIPQAHGPVALQAIAAGKHVWNEKPLAVDREEGRQVLDAARRKGVRVGGAPDTFLGAGIQTARRLIDQGAIGRPVAGTAFMMGRGHESWHPDPEFYYKPGGGPMFDMGPYYLTALMNLLGPIDRISAITSIAIPERIITSKPRHGTKIQVETPDHLAGTILFKSGAVVSIITSFATAHARHDRKQPITIYGTDGTLAVPDPNGFDGPVTIARGIAPVKKMIDGKEQAVSPWEDVPFAHATGYGRIVGVADMASAIRNHRPHRGSGEQAYAVLEAMQGFLDASRQERAYQVEANYQRPAPMPTGLKLGEMD